ncbi:MAG: glycosyltransferase family 4 protein [Elusimicrobia bacterium]|nr:glycosyltransferase family 4 protein [Elusimicrobiota bacterium]
MKLAHVVDEPYDSGIVHYALSAARGLAAAGHHVEVWGRPGCFPILEAARLGLKTRPLGGVTDLWGLRRAVSGVELINAHTGSSHTLALAIAKSLSEGPKVVRTRADARPVRRGPAGGVLWSRTAGFIAPTQLILSQFREQFPSFAGAAAAIHPGFESGEARPEPEGPLRVGIVARLDPVKGHADFLKAAADVALKHPDAKFLIAGREENVKRARIEALVSNLGLRGRVEVLGHVPDAVEFMRTCHLGVVASTGSEAVSRVAVEWMSAGRPVIATAVGCLPEFVTEESGHLVAPADPRALGTAIAALLGDAARRRRLGQGARRRFESEFALPRFVKETESFYDKTLRAVSSR